ncbi:hypothetical protein [Aeromicrobium piscarium]|uniref:DUF4352 domain-containing protein n=1 Tax=Aeromicrobium piscarium TaxID=2590901 RepID=A0A554SGJ5_9ACTN|nr:hypothetical protein [Aeromicrobium piscarium]TSD65472.1 hypothetical protein FNM00_03330 [Aeromicrobium piscarium]
MSRTPWYVGTMLALALVASGCSGGDDEEEPTGLEVPDGVTLNEGGTELDLGESATVAYPEDAEDATALTVTVTAVDTGDIADFSLFSLSEEDAASSPRYVRVTVVNEGPGTPGTTSLPIFAHTDDRTLLTANSIVGSFEPCPPTPVPADLEAGEEIEQCLVYLLPADRQVESIDLQVTDAASAIRWTVPAPEDTPAPEE